MCNPMVATLVMGVAQSATAYSADVADFNAQMDVRKQNYVNTLAATRDEQKQLQLRQIQEQDALSQKLKLADIEEAEAAASAEASAAASGVSGISVDNILADITRKSATNREADRQNYQNAALQLNSELLGTVNKAKSRINSTPEPVAPSVGALAVDLAGVGFKSAKEGGLIKM